MNWMRYRDGLGAVALTNGYPTPRRIIQAPAPAPAPQTRLHRVITGTDVMCCISLEPIPIGGEYHMCHQCSHPFTSGPFQEWIRERNSCPTCRARNQSQSLQTVYINSAEPAGDQPAAEPTGDQPAAEPTGDQPAAEPIEEPELDEEFRDQPVRELPLLIRGERHVLRETRRVPRPQPTTEE